MKVPNHPRTITAGALAGLALAACRAEPQGPAPAVTASAAAPARDPAAAEAERQAIARQVQEENAEVVQDAKLEATGVLLAGVLDDGGRRDGLAQTLCLGLPASVWKVRVVDVAAAGRGQYRTLGEAECPRPAA